MNEIMVSICCITYNHEKYISQALDSFLMQKTSFKYEILIHDDASTDNTANIIREYEKNYPEIMKPIYQTINQYSKKVKVSMIYNYPRAKGKYIAMCEGDDYWTDPYKLQKQIDYMELNENCSLCAHASEIVLSNSLKKINEIRPRKTNSILSIEETIRIDANFLATSSLLFPTKYMKELPDFYINCPIGDYPLKIYLALKGYTYYIDNFMSAYRYMADGSWTSTTSQNDTARIEHCISIIKMLKEVDTYTNYQYADTINDTILYNEFIISTAKYDIHAIKDKKYKTFYNSINITERIRIHLKAYFPFLSILWRRLKAIYK